MESLFNNYTSDDENEGSCKDSPNMNERTEASKEMDANYESITMDMSEDSSDASSNRAPPIEDTVRKKYGTHASDSSSPSDSCTDSESSRDSCSGRRRGKEKSRSKTKERSLSPSRRSSSEKIRDERYFKNDRRSRDKKSVDRNGRGRRSRDHSPGDRRQSRSHERRSRDDKLVHRNRDENLDKKSGKRDRDYEDKNSRKRYSRSPSDKDRYRSKRYRSQRSRSRSRSRRSKSRSHSRRRSRSRSSSESPRYRSRHHRHNSRDNRRSRERSHNRSSLSYASEKTKNKLQVLEKLGIELKVPPELPNLLHGNCNAGASQVNPQSLLQKSLKEQVEKVKSVTGIELPSYYNPAAVNPTKYAEQIQKRRLLWGNKDKQLNNAGAVTQPSQTARAAPSTAPGGGETIWQGAKFGDQDGKMTAKFQRLMGIKQPSVEPTPGSSVSGPEKSELIKKQEEMFSSMESQYEVARLATHTHRGVGLGFGTFQYPR